MDTLSAVIIGVVLLVLGICYSWRELKKDNSDSNVLGLAGGALVLGGIFLLVALYKGWEKSML